MRSFGFHNRPTLPRIASIARLLGFFLGLRMLPGGLLAADSSAITFALPAGNAEQTLRLFSKQSGWEVLFLTGTAAGVTTNEVKGLLTPQEAIERLLANSRLKAVPNMKMRAVRIVPAENVSSPARKQGTRNFENHQPPSAALKQPSISHPRTNSMYSTATSTSGVRRLIGAFASLFLGTMTVDAQVLNPANPESLGAVHGRVLDATRGEYLKNARVTLVGSDREALTNDFGEYRLSNVPAGTATLRISYVGWASRELNVTIRAGESVTQDVEFGGRTDQEGSKAIMMDAFTVAANREMDGKAIAISEQRYAAGIVNVVAADEYGDVTEGNVGEFLKYLPGVLVDYNAAAARTISLRGLPPSTTPVSMDGNRMASAASGSASRTFEFEQVSINNISRVEVSKSATPDRPADSLGGSVNMVSKSAFERSKALFTYRAYMNMNDTAMKLGSSPMGPDGKRENLAKPGFDFTYIKPVSRNFGFVVTGLFSSNYNPQTLSQTNWIPLAGGIPGGSPAAVTGDTPYMASYRVQTSPQTTERSSVGLTADWRVSPRDVISLRGQYSRFDNYFYIANYTFDTSLISSFGPTFSYGAANRGNFYASTGWRRKVGSTWQPSLSYRHTGETWTIEAGGYHSSSDNSYRDIDEGFFNGVTTGVTNATIAFDNLRPDRPGTITVTKGGVVIDPFKLSNQQIITTPTSVNNSGYQGQVNSNQSEATDTMRGAHASFKRDFHLAVPVALKFGLDYRQNLRDIRVAAPVWRYNGPDGIYSTGEPAGPLLNTTFSTVAAPYGFGTIEWIDSSKMFELFKAHPDQFAEQLNGPYGTIQRRVNGSQYIDESVSAGYLRADVRLFKSRLLVVGGVRYERTRAGGEGPLNDANAIYQRDAKGELVLGANGRPVPITTDATEQTRLRFKERGAHVSRSYDGYYPSANASFRITDNLIARASYARTIGRPDFGNIIPSTVLPDLGGASMDIRVKNTALLPWEADNFDLSLEYYFQKAGVLSAGVFRKDFSNFFGASVMPATPELLQKFGLEPEYAGYNILTTTNVGDARVTGLELNYSQQLTFLPDFARGVSVFANGTSLDLEGSTIADFNAFVRRNGSWGVSLNRPRYSLMLKWIYRDDQRLLARTGSGVPPGTYQWLKGSLKLDINAEYRLQKHVSLFANARNITNEPYVLGYYNEGTPSYARQYNTQDFGVQYTLGVKGSF